jgi:D-glycero-alpha-D-manno-heptose-7-phosphate kinase
VNRERAAPPLVLGDRPLSTALRSRTACGRSGLSAAGLETLPRRWPGPAPLERWRDAVPAPGAGTAVLARAPLRVSFGGGGTDLAAYYEPFEGLVVSAAIARYCYVVASRPAVGGVRITSADYGVCETFGPGEPPPVEEPLALASAAIERFWGHGLRERGVDLLLAAQVPPGSGLGGSSAMAVALVRALAAYTGTPLPTREAAELASWLEIERLGRPIGKQDQYASAYGGLNAITFAAERVRVTPLALPTSVLAALESRLLLFWTGRTHDSAAILRQQRAATGTSVVVTEHLHRLKALAADMRDALQAADLDGFGGLLDVAWRHKRALSAGVSSATIDGWYDAARDAGALGGKIAGAGGVDRAGLEGGLLRIRLHRRTGV